MTAGPAKFQDGVCSFAGFIDVPMFETPFFAAGAGPRSFVSGRFTAAVCPQTGPNRLTQAYRPDVTVLNNTPSLIPPSINDAWAYCMTPYFLCSTDHPSGVQTGWNQRVPFGANEPNPHLSTRLIVPNPGADGGSACFEGLLANYNSFPVTTIADRGILVGWNLFAYDPASPGANTEIIGPDFSSSAGFGWPQGSYVTAQYPIIVNGQLTNVIDDNMYFLGGGLPTGQTQCGIVRWGNRPNADLSGTVTRLSFDTASLNTQLANPSTFAAPPGGTLACRFGFIIPTLTSTTPGQARDIMLIDMRGGFYRLIRLVAQTPRASAFIAGATSGFCFHIDQSGIAYALDYNDGGRLYTSFGLDIPLTAPGIPPFQFAPLPCFSPCYPFFLTPAV